MEGAEAVCEQIHLGLRFFAAHTGREPANDGAGSIVAVAQQVVAGMDQRFKAERKPEIRRADGGAGEIVRGDADDGEGRPIQADGFAHNVRISVKAPLPVVFADENGGRSGQSSCVFRLEGSATQRGHAQHGKVVLADHGYAGQLGAAARRAGRQHSPSLKQRRGCGAALPFRAAGSGKNQLLILVAGSREAAERMQVVSIGEVVGVAEVVIDFALLPDGYYAHHAAGVASIEAAQQKHLVCSENRGVQSNAQRQRHNRRRRESRIAQQHPRSEAHILQHRLRPQHQVHLPQPLPPQRRISEPHPCPSSCLRIRHPLLRVPLLAHRHVKLELFLELPLQFVSAQ